MPININEKTWKLFIQILFSKVLTQNFFSYQIVVIKSLHQDLFHSLV